MSQPSVSDAEEITYSVGNKAKPGFHDEGDAITNY